MTACTARDEQFDVEDVLVLVLVGPGREEDDVIKARGGRWYSGLSVPVHEACSGHPEVPASDTPGKFE